MSVITEDLRRGLTGGEFGGVRMSPDGESGSKERQEECAGQARGPWS